MKRADMTETSMHRKDSFHRPWHIFWAEAICYSIVELNLLSLAFISEPYTLAMLHYDFQQRLQLLARDVSIEELQLSPAPSPLLPPLPLPGKWFSVEEQAPRLIFVPSVETSDDDFEGGILVVGGRKILLYDLASRDVLEKNLRRGRRAEKKKRSGDADEAAKAKEKEKEREWRKKKARAAVAWPWSEVTAYVFVHPSFS
jgi:DNA damage-binding protein 1